MMCDTNWCTFCDNAISPLSDSLYCSERCLRQDALLHHPMLGYDFSELEGFPHVKTTIKKPIPNPPNRICLTHKPPSSQSSLSSSFSSICSEDDLFTVFHQPKIHHFSPIHLTQRIDQTMLQS